MEEQVKKWEELQNKIKAEITNLENNKTADNKKLRQLKRELDKLLKETQSLMATNIKLEVKLGANSVDSAINKLTGETLTPNRLNTPGLQDLINENALNFKSAVNYVNREINTMVREAQKLTNKINVIDTANRAEFEAELKRKMTEAGVVAMKTTDGKNLQLDKYVKMATQTTLKIARNKGVIEQCKVRGIDLVKMSEHFPTCSICTPLQGRVYSISGDSKEYPALSIPFSGGYEVVHPNCKHSFMPYLPEYLPKETVEKDKEKSNRSFEVFNQFEKEQLERYNQQQKKKSTVNRIRKEYDNIALAIGKDNMPSFTGFRNSKRSNGPVYNEVKEKYNLAIGKTTENVDNYVENSVDNSIALKIKEFESKQELGSINFEYKPNEIFDKYIKNNNFTDEELGIFNYRTEIRENLLAKKIYNEKGYNAKPLLLDEKDFNNLDKDKYEIVYRGVQDNKESGLTAKEINEQFKTGELYYGSGLYGGGTYTTGSIDMAKHYGKDDLMAMAFRKDAKIVNIDDVENMGVYENGNYAKNKMKAETLSKHYEGVNEYTSSLESKNPIDTNTPFNIANKLLGSKDLQIASSGADIVRVPFKTWKQWFTREIYDDLYSKFGDEINKDYYVIINRGAVIVRR